MSAKKISKSLSPTVVQQYPRLEEGQFAGYLDDSKLVQHPEPRQITPKVLKTLILRSIHDAEEKSSRLPFEIPPNLTPDQEGIFYSKEGHNLFTYFHDYPTDPAATAHEYYQKNYRDVGIDLFRNRMLQKGRMNSGWRYQFLAVECASQSGRFRNVSGIGTSKGDFSAIINLAGSPVRPVNLYVSVKNRSDTLGGQDWPNSIVALESYAKSDQNKMGAYCCVFGIAMDRGQRRIPRRRSGEAYSNNTEVWLSDFFWPFFSAYRYEEIMTAVLEALMAVEEDVEVLPTQINVPDKVLDAFGAACREAELTDELGNFTDAFKLVRFFCQITPSQSKKTRKKKE
ncbi:MAG: hypothetical protein ABI947_17000 [Chloroflexota bacterium]